MANQKISTYLTEVLALIPNDRLDISKEISPGVFDTQFLRYSTLLTELNGDLSVSVAWSAALATGNTSGANDAIWSKLGVASSTGTQQGSQKISLQNSLWSGAVEEVKTFDIYAAASVTVNGETNLLFDYDGATRAVMTEAGSWGLGTSTPTQKLEVSGSIKMSLTSYAIYSGADKFIHRTGHDNNVYIGKQTGLVTTGVNNTGIGSTALNDLLGGGSNVAFGQNAAAIITTGNDNTAIGANSLFALNGAKQTGNTVIGKSTLTNLISGNYNTSVGASSGQAFTGGDFNSFLGYATGYETSGTFDRSVVLGYNTKARASNQFVVGASGGSAQLDDWFIGRGIDQAALSGGGISFEMSVTSIEAGVTDVSSEYDWNFNASRGTGTGDGGEFIWKTAPAGTTGSAQNALVEALRINQEGVVVFKSFTVATLPAVAAGGVIRVSDETGGDTIAYSDGTNWLRASDGAVVS